MRFIYLVSFSLFFALASSLTAAEFFASSGDHPTSRLENVWNARRGSCSVVLRRHTTSIYRARRTVLILCSSSHGWIVKSRNHGLRELDLLPLIIGQRRRLGLILPWRTWRRVSTCAPRRGHHRLDLIQLYRHRWDVRQDLSIWRF